VLFILKRSSEKKNVKVVSAKSKVIFINGKKILKME
jgi:hypothetical protein